MPSAKIMKVARKVSPETKPAEALPARPQTSTAGRDAKLHALRAQWKQELAGIMEAAARRRKRAKPAQMQSILLQEMDQIRHAGANYRSAADMLMKETPMEERKEKVQEFRTGATDKRPSQKAAKLSLAE